MAKPGDPIVLDFQLHDFATDKFVKATITEDGVESAESPIQVPHIGNGRFFFIDKVDLIFPMTEFEVAVLYEVFNNTLLTTRSKKHGPGIDKFRKVSVSIDQVDDIVDQITDLIEFIVAAVDKLRVIDGEVEILSTELEIDVDLISVDDEEFAIILTEESEVVLEIEDSGLEFDTEIASLDDEISVIFEND